jgi:hypothetical protein
MSRTTKAKVVIEKITRDNGYTSSAAEDLKRAFQEQMEALGRWNPEPPPPKKIPFPPTTSKWSSGPLQSKVAWEHVQKPEVKRRFQACADRHEFNIKPGSKGAYVWILQFNICMLMSYFAFPNDIDSRDDYLSKLTDWISTDNDPNITIGDSGNYGPCTKFLVTEYKKINEIYTFGTKQIDPITGINTIRSMDVFYTHAFG